MYICIYISIFRWRCIRRHLHMCKLQKHTCNQEIQVCAHTYADRYLHVYIYTYACIPIIRYIYTYIQIYIYTNIHMYMYIYLHICIYIYTYIHTQMHMYIYTSIHICICIHIHIYDMVIYIHVHIYICIHMWALGGDCSYGNSEAFGFLACDTMRSHDLAVPLVCKAALMSCENVKCVVRSCMVCSPYRAALAHA